MLHRFCVVVAVLLCGVAAASAQSCQDPINTRQKLMKRSGAMAKIGSDMIKGAIPFDLAKSKEILAAFAEDANSMPDLFPECSKTGDHTSVGPAIWERPANFKAAIAKFQADVKHAQETTKDLETLKASFQTIGKDCGGCHQTFRARSS